MSKQIIKVLSILLTVCFLMTVTAVAVSAQATDNTGASQAMDASQNNANGLMQGKGSLQGGLSPDKPIYIKNLVFARNVAIFNDRSTHPLLRTALLKKIMSKDLGNMSETMSETGNEGATDITGAIDDTGTADITGATDNTGTTGSTTGTTGSTM